MFFRLLPPTRSGATLTLAIFPRWCSTRSGQEQEGKESFFKEEKATEDAAGALSVSNTGSNVEKKSGFLEPSDDVVLEYARHALQREGRDKKPEAVVWQWDTTYSPILSKGKQNFYDYTDDIPKHVKPFWHHEYYQQREYFQLQRGKRPVKERLRTWGIGLACVFVAGAVLTFVRVWIEQPREIRQLREEMLQQAYGKVLELAAGHGQNIGAYPYAVHEVVMCDSNAQQLQALRYRIPRASYPKYDVHRVRSENLDIFADGEFDCVVDMFGLCHLHDPVKALRQMQRVVKPSGLILLLEHGGSPYAPVNWFLNFFEQRHTVNTHGCKWNSPIRDYLRESRMEIKELRNMHYGTTYYVVAYPEVLEAFKDRGALAASAAAV
ncbi:hypothetical protein TRSC58_01582 [Trypanosoma rangeli SC58]|uniref:Methyltransferase type 11 domain-containing protein n=1 Tax=Trypanosoma rangeli SC58 TaxID=429131 RepID=A0A061J8M7_TRYRA|nr:hypothetical protein TRSC58_01582 [Trypanosoma rangeli SC58]